MRRYLKIIALSLAVVFGATTMTSCYGKFMLTKKIHTWNGTVSSNKFINNLVFWVLVILPVYGIGTLVDGVILNVVEFWTGSNPMAMKEGEKEVKKVAVEGNDYQITATKNRLDIVQLTGDEKGKTTSMVYNETSKSWFMNQNDAKILIAQIQDDNSALFINPYE
jgi:hypothetical protein